MKSNSLIVMGLVALMAGGGFIVSSSDVFASHINFEQRRAEREAQREARRAERAAEREARRAQREARRAERRSDKEKTEPTCNCRSRLKFSDPDLQWRGSALVLVPRVDVDIRTRGDVTEDPDWKAVLKYNGVASYSSDDIQAPTNRPAFSGTEEIAGGMCGDNRYSFEGYALEAVPLTGLTSALVTGDQELEGLVTMNATLEGCDLEEESRALDFTVESFGNLDVGRWGFAR